MEGQLKKIHAHRKSEGGVRTRAVKRHCISCKRSDLIKHMNNSVINNHNKSFLPSLLPDANDVENQRISAKKIGKITAYAVKTSCGIYR